MEITWKEENGRLKGVVRFDTFRQALNFAQQVGEVAERLSHHPEIHILYTTVQLELWSHDTGVVTERDRQLAKAIENLVE